MGFLDNLVSQAQNLTGVAQTEDAAADAEVASFSPVSRKSYVTCDVLNVRPTPSTKENRVGQVKRGTEITVLAACGDWLKIDFEGAERYVFAAYTDFNAPEATVTASSLNVRKAPGTDADKIGSLANGSVVRALSVENGWVKILYNGHIGYVSKDYLA